MDGDLQVLDVSARELGMGDDLNLATVSLAFVNLLDFNQVAEVASAALVLHVVLEELDVGIGVEDVVASGLLGIDEELKKRAHVSNYRHVAIGE